MNEELSLQDLIKELNLKFQSCQSRYIGQWVELLRIKSISTDVAFESECLIAANWLVEHLGKLGLSAKLLETGSKPVVYAERKVDASRPTVLFYGHYDVQPVDPLELWSNPPFSPELRDGRLFARGAQDNKGQLFYVVKAIEALIEVGALNCNLKILIEGEEECGSGGLARALSSWKEQLKADILMVCDTGSLAPGLPAITMGLRGIASLSAVLEGPNKDLHSGVHGGVVRNPALEIARLAASLHNSDGSIAVAGYYDGVKEPAAEDRQLANQVPLLMEQYQQLVGVAPDGGEQQYTAWERRGFRPTIEVNGIHSGYGGAGGKTIIPSKAELKLSLRLVAGQNPARCLELVQNHLRQNCPQSLKLSFTDIEQGGQAVIVSSKSQVIQQAAAVLQQVCGTAPIYLWEGASIPIVTDLASISGATPLLVGFGLEEDNIHAPNESFAIEQFRLGFLYAGAFLGSVGIGSSKGG